VLQRYQFKLPWDRLVRSSLLQSMTKSSKEAQALPDTCRPMESQRWEKERVRHQSLKTSCEIGWGAICRAILNSETNLIWYDAMSSGRVVHDLQSLPL
jgi:hypothetical protein